VKTILVTGSTDGIGRATALALAEQGCAVIVSSSYPPELLRLCDRTLVMDEGEVVAEFDRANADQEKLLSAALGVSS
jgi:ABC-type sugar transport system ATPase subunit